MSDAAAFRATFAGMRSLTDGSLRFSYDVDGPEIQKALDVLTHGGMPSAAKGTWFAIARLVPTEGEGATLSHDRVATTPLDHNVKTIGESASGCSSPELSPARTLSTRIYLHYCMKPVFRRFLEEFFQDIVASRDINNAEFAKEVVKLRLGIGSLSEVDSDPVASEQAEQLLNLFASWERGYVEAP